MGFNDLNRNRSSAGGATEVKITGPLSTFGELSVISVRPVAQGDFVYGINNQTFTTSSFSGASISVVSGNVELSSGADSYGSATVQLRRQLEYRAGQGSLMKATAIYDTPNTGSAQFIGAGSAESGYFIGYFGSQFGVLHSITGQREVRKYTVTSGAGAGTVNATVTLDGDSVVVPLTNATDIYSTAYQLSNADYSQVGRGGWLADVCSGSIYFISSRSSNLFTGSYSISGGTIAGSFTRTLAGENQTSNFIPSSSFNVDKLDGTGPSEMVLDPQKGNVYQIGVQYLGYGNAKFSVEDPETGVFTMFHMIKNANTRTTPVLKNPSMAVLATSANIGGTQSTVLKSASMAAFTEGEIYFYDPKFSKSFTFTNVNESSYVPLFSMKANRIFNDLSNYGEFDLLKVAASNEVNNKTLTIGLFLNEEVSDSPNFQNVDEENSIVSIAEFDPSNDTFVNPSPVPFYEVTIGSASSRSEALEDLRFVFGVGDKVTIGIKTTAQMDGTVSVSWFEQQ